jgi:hypothetical protein
VLPANSCLVNAISAALPVGMDSSRKVKTPASGNNSLRRFLDNEGGISEHLNHLNARGCPTRTYQLINRGNFTG